MIIESVTEEERTPVIHHVDLLVARTCSRSIYFKGKQHPSISVKDLMGGEKNAPGVTHMYRHKESPSTQIPYSRHKVKSSAEAKIQIILEARKTKKNRRDSITNSLESAMLPKHLNGINRNLENESEEEEAGEMGLNDDEDNEQRSRPRRTSRCESPSRLKRRTVTREQRKSSFRSSSHGTSEEKKDDQSEVTPTQNLRKSLLRPNSPGSLRERKGESRRKVERSNSSDSLHAGSTPSQRKIVLRSNSQGSLQVKKEELRRKTERSGSLRFLYPDGEGQQSSMSRAGSSRSLQVNEHEDRRSMERENSSGALQGKKNEKRRSFTRPNSSRSLQEATSPVTTRVKSKATSGPDDGEVNKASTSRRRRSQSRTRDRSKSRTRDRSKSRTRDRSKSRTRDRSKSQSRDDGSVDTNTSRRRSRRSSRGADVVRDRSKDPSSRRSRSKSRTRLEDDDEADDRSTSRNTSATSRRGRRPGNKTKREVDGDTTSDDNEEECNISPHSSSSRRGRRPGASQQLRKLYGTNSSVESPIVSPTLSTSSSSTSSSLTSHLGMSPPLGAHIEGRKKMEKDSLSVVSEKSSESSKHSGVKAESVLLQFDPTNENLVRTVDQATAKKKKDTIRTSDGTKSKVVISQLDGLPTFEKQMSAQSLNASFLTPTESTRSMHSVDGCYSGDEYNDISATSFRLRVAKQGSTGSILEMSQQSLDNSSTSNSRWPMPRSALGNNLQAKKSSFFQRVQKSKADVADRLMKHSTMNKAGMRLGLATHQALDDDDDDFFDDQQSLLR